MIQNLRGIFTVALGRSRGPKGDGIGLVPRGPTLRPLLWLIFSATSPARIVPARGDTASSVGAWYVDVEARTVTVSRLADGAWLEVSVHGELERVRLDPFGEAELDLGLWWPSPTP